MTMKKLADFESHIHRKMGSRSKDLKALVSAISTFTKRHSETHLRNIYQCFIRWKRNDPKEFNNRGRPIERDFYKLIAEQADILGVELAAIIPDAMTAQELVDKHRWALDRMKGFASGDCRQFPGNINPRKKEQVISRYDKAVSENRNMGGSGSASVGIGAFFNNTDWNGNKVRRSYYTVYKNKAGVCTSLAESAAHLLTDGWNVTSLNMPRVEIMSSRNHVFVVVGRSSNTNPPQHYDDWGNSWYLVDPWAGAMGYDVIYEQTKGIPHKYGSMYTNVKLIMGTR